MGDLGDTFREFKKHNQAKRARNVHNARPILDAHGIQYTVHNHGQHLKIIRDNRPYVDFWPSKGRWRPIGIGWAKFGIFNLIDWLGVARVDVSEILGYNDINNENTTTQ